MCMGTIPALRMRAMLRASTLGRSQLFSRGSEARATCLPVFPASGPLLALGIACVSGLVGAAIVFYFLAKILIRKDEDLNPADYDMIGVLGTVSSNIRPAGTGEMIFSQAGTRRSAAARSEDGVPIEKGTEIVVTRYERGIAYVRPWEELTNSLTESKQN